MGVTIAEVATDIYRINAELPGRPVSYSFFLIKDEEPTLVETGFAALFDETLAAVRQVVDPSTLRHIVVPHFEGDECGALNQFLEVAPRAVPICSPIGVLTTSDFALRAPVGVTGDDTLVIGSHRLRFLITPYVHQWDSMLAFDETTRTLFSSDVFIQPGPGPATTDADLTDSMIGQYQTIGLFPSRPHLDSALDTIEALAPATLACHHGSVKSGQIPAYIRAMREADITDVVSWNPLMREPAGGTAP